MNGLCFLLMVVGQTAGQPEPATEPASPPPAAPRVTVGSKAFTESVIVGEILVGLAESSDIPVRHQSELGGTKLVWTALLDGDVDVYLEYTGTIAESILQKPGLDEDAMRQELADRGVKMTRSIGYENSYALGMSRRRAEQLGIKTISDLKKHPRLWFGFAHEFLNRSDGWLSLKEKYNLTNRVRGLDHTLAYLALDSGDIDVMDIYTTDANIKKYDLVALTDDLDHFPDYGAVIVYRSDLAERAPKLVSDLTRLESFISEDDMLGMNVEVDVNRMTKAWVANNFLATRLQIGTVIPPPTFSERFAALTGRLAVHTLEHMLLVIVSLTLAITIAVPLGVIAAKRPAVGHFILSTAEIIQTIPGLALLILLMTPIRFVDQLLTPIGITGLSVVGPVPAIIALFMYSLLPIIRNTYTGIRDIPESIHESAVALGLTRGAQLWQIELPLASRLILAGVKTTAVINVGYATLGGLIGAGGYGQAIMQGLYDGDEWKMLEGAVPAAVLALIVKWLFEVSERFIVPRGLK